MRSIGYANGSWLSSRRDECDLQCSCKWCVDPRRPAPRNGILYNVLEALHHAAIERVIVVSGGYAGANGCGYLETPSRSGPRSGPTDPRLESEETQLDRFNRETKSFSSVSNQVARIMSDRHEIRVDGYSARATLVRASGLRTCFDNR